jgi:CheY-like chemotaxis protein
MTQPPARRPVHALEMKADALLPPVMVVDDNDDDVVLLTRQLKSAGILNPVLHFRNGGDAFMHLKQFCPAETPRARLPVVMFLDVNMQGLSGFDVLVWARTQSTLARMKIYMLSGANEIFDAQIAAKLGADDYFEKFPEPAALRQLLEPFCTTDSFGGAFVRGSRA